MVVHGIFVKNGGSMDIDHRREACTPHLTYVSLPMVTLLDFWWRPILGKKSIGFSLQYY
jgi:hypothetical protein